MDPLGTDSHSRLQNETRRRVDGPRASRPTLPSLLARRRSEALDVRREVLDLRRRQAGDVAVLVAAARAVEAVLHRLRAAVVDEGSTPRHADERRDLEGSARTDVTRLVVRERRTRVAGRAA